MHRDQRLNGLPWASVWRKAEQIACPYQNSSLAADLAFSFRGRKARAWAVNLAASMEIDANVVSERVHCRRRWGRDRRDARSR